MKDEVGMERPKSTQNKICRDNHIHYTSLRLLFSIIMCLLMVIRWCYLLNLNLVRRWEKIMLSPIIMAYRGGGIDCRITAWLVYSRKQA